MALYPDEPMECWPIVYRYIYKISIYHASKIPFASLWWTCVSNQGHSRNDAKCGSLDFFPELFVWSQMFVNYYRYNLKPEIFGSCLLELGMNWSTWLVDYWMVYLIVYCICACIIWYPDRCSNILCNLWMKRLTFDCFCPWLTVPPIVPVLLPHIQLTELSDMQDGRKRSTRTPTYFLGGKDVLIPAGDWGGRQPYRLIALYCFRCWFYLENLIQRSDKNKTCPPELHSSRGLACPPKLQTNHQAKESLSDCLIVACNEFPYHYIRYYTLFTPWRQWVGCVICCLVGSLFFRLSIISLCTLQKQ